MSALCQKQRMQQHATVQPSSDTTHRRTRSDLGSALREVQSACQAPLPAPSAGLVRQPLRQAWSVGIAALGKIGPVRRHCISKPVIVRLPWPAAHHMEIVEDVINLGEVIDARRCERIKGEFGRAGRPAREIVPVDWRPAARRSPLPPGPTAVRNNFIAEQCRHRCLLVLRRRSWWINFQRRVGLILELRANSFRIRSSRQLNAGCKKTSLIGVPADEQRHIILLTLGIDRRWVLRHYISVNDTESIRDWVLDRGFENFLGRSGAQFANRIHPHRLDEFDTILFTNVQGLWPERSNRGERAAALTDDAPEQALCQW